MALVRRPDTSDEDSDEARDEVLAIGASKRLEDDAMDEADRLEKEMNDMYRELEDMQKMIEGNKDLKCMEQLMGTT
jgi:hypothetical protein